MPNSPAKDAEIRDFEIAAARLYVQDGLSIAQIAERLCCNMLKVDRAIRRVGLPRDNRHTFAW